MRSATSLAMPAPAAAGELAAMQRKTAQTTVREVLQFIQAQKIRESGPSGEPEPLSTPINWGKEAVLRHHSQAVIV